MNLEQYFENTLTLFLSTSHFLTRRFTIAGRTIEIKFSSEELLNHFLPAIRHLEHSTNENPQLILYAGDGASLPFQLKAPPWINENFNAQGYASKIDQREVQIFFQPWIPQLYLYSRKYRMGIYWVKSVDEIPWWEKTFSFRIVFHWWTRDLPAQLVHAGAVADNTGNGFLVTGPSGSGKSTTCLNLVKNGYGFLGDDYLWIELGSQNKIIALYQTAKLDADNFLQRFPSWIPRLLNPETFETEKAVVDMKKIFPDQWLAEAPLKGILLPKITGGLESNIERARQAHSLMAIAPTTLHHLPHHREISFRKIAEIVSETKTFRWHLSTRESDNIHAFQEFITDVQHSG